MRLNILCTSSDMKQRVGKLPSSNCFLVQKTYFSHWMVAANVRNCPPLRMLPTLLLKSMCSMKLGRSSLQTKPARTRRGGVPEPNGWLSGISPGGTEHTLCNKVSHNELYRSCIVRGTTL